MSATDATTATATERPREYGFSVLLTGFAQVWRAPAAMWAAIGVNAVAQGLLVWPDPVASLSVTFVLLALASLLVLLLAAGLVTAAALEAVAGRAGIAAAAARLQRHLGSFALWFVLLLLALLVGSMLYTVPAFLVAVLTPFVLLAAMDGHRNALGANVRAIGSRWGRWLVTALLMAVVVAVSWLLAAVTMFFVTGPAAAFIVWVWFGFLFAWFQCAWAVLFRSTTVGALPTP